MNYGNNQQATALRDIPAAEPIRPIPATMQDLHQVVSDTQGAASDLLRRLEGLAPGGLAMPPKATEQATKSVPSKVRGELEAVIDALRDLTNVLRLASERIEL